jgi:inhibitor of KinA
VGIGGAQTGVYPQNSSGGWNIIGKSPLNLFNMKATNPCFAKPGDRIQFVAVCIHTFHEIEREVIKQEFIIKKRPL